MASSRNKRSTEENLLPSTVANVLEAALKAVEGLPRLCVAYSGGVDSTVLLHLLLAWRNRANTGKVRPFELWALHVNHGISPHADEWESHCRSQCAAWAVPFEAVRVAVLRDAGEGLEAAARVARYDALTHAQADFIILGHHRDDQAETLLLNLLRGAGVVGASAMMPTKGRFLRPLLDVPRSSIEAYARTESLDWVSDESNANLCFTRNYLRHQVVPLLSERFPSAVNNLARAAKAFADASALLHELALEDGAGETPLPLSSLASLSQTRALNVLAFHLREQGLRIASRRWLEEALRQALSAGSDRQLAVEAGGFVLRRHQGKLHVCLAETVPLPPKMWSAQAVTPWGMASINAFRGKGMGIGAAHVAVGCWEFRCRVGGERFALRKGMHRCLKDLLREAAIPPWQRQRLPLLFRDGELVWVPGVGIAEKYRCGPQEDGISLEFGRSTC